MMLLYVHRVGNMKKVADRHEQLDIDIDIDILGIIEIDIEIELEQQCQGRRIWSE